jgi:hypothetical protein
MEFNAQGNFFEAIVFRQWGGKAPLSTQVLDSLQKRQNYIFKVNPVTFTKIACNF